jgi:hypothetical protein
VLQVSQGFAACRGALPELQALNLGMCLCGDFACEMTGSFFTTAELRAARPAAALRGWREGAGSWTRAWRGGGIQSARGTE